MGFARQTWQLTAKNVRVVLFRHWFGTILRAFLLPIFFVRFHVTSHMHQKPNWELESWAASRISRKLMRRRAGHLHRLL